MTKEKFKKVLKEAYTAGECDNYVEDRLIESACDYIGQEVTGHITNKQHDAIIEAYRTGFLGTDRAVKQYIKRVKANRK